MTRTVAREIAVHLSFEAGVNDVSAQELLDTVFDPEYYATLAQEDELYSEYPDEKQMEYIRTMTVGVCEHLPELDSYIEKYAKNWRVGRISRVAVAIMRICMYEILYMPEIPDAASVNEAVELTKKYEDKEVVSFVNGILGSYIKGEKNGD
ncbi:MAG: transcription antitermination factor NusB [Oscillospiraceae bacterium]|nr:transcription antitermination factor NusB [Oscillospiraceae bacterium]